MLWRSAGLLVVSALQVAIGDELSCDFIKPCCWTSLDDNNKWQIKSSRSINFNDYRRTFIVGRTRSPPVGNYLIQNGDKSRSMYGSCKFCSIDDEVNIQYRYWQSPSVKLKLCWRRWGEPIRDENCHLTKPSRQSQIISQNLIVPRGKDVQVFFIMEKEKGAINGIVMIDRIFLTVKKCGTPNTERVTSFISRSGAHNNEKYNRSTVTIKDSEARRGNDNHDLPPQMTSIDEEIRNELINETKERTTNDVINTSKHKDYTKKSGEVARSKAAKFRTITSTSDVSTTKTKSSALPVRRSNHSSRRFLPERSRVLSSPSRNIPPPSPPANVEDLDPLTELLGKEFVEFLDPNYVTKDDETNNDYDDTDFSPATSILTSSHFQQPLNKATNSKVLVGPTAVQAPTLLMMLNRPLSLLPPQPCYTVGGCLFERSMCSYTHPPGTPTSIQFQPVKVGLSNFIRARVPPGVTSSLQTDTYMNEAHTVFFDALEWKSGARLIGCCEDVNGDQKCPFSTPFEAGVMLWQSASFDCPASTSKIRFICENFGNDEAECCIDSIRVHRLSDTFLLEPCQKNILSSI